MVLEDFGYNDRIEKLMLENNLHDLEVGRVVSEHKESYIVKTEKGELKAEVTGKLRFSAKGREDFPAVGDWVSLTIHDSEFSLIHDVLPRSSIISRQAVGHFGEIQIIATNIDYALLLQAVDRDFNINRLERYLTICYAAKVKPIIVLTKIDVLNEQRIAEISTSISQRIDNIPIVAISNKTQAGYDELTKLIQKGNTYCMLGSSGVGKSSLLNNLYGTAIMQTNAISKSTNKGRHVTTHRELVLLDNGGLLIDNPGMREVGVVDTTQGLETTFDKIFDLTKNCRFKDCTHTNEAGCSVLEAVENGELDKGSYESYLKIKREKAHFESSVAERRKKDKAFGKMVKGVKKDLSKTK